LTGRRILLTCRTLARRSGSEAATRDLAVALLRRGHTPIVYSPELGDLAQEIRLATVPVIDDLAALAAPPDLIHGNHHPETMTALLAFPGVPAVHTCHAWFYPEAMPPRFPRILRYIAVDDTCRDRLLWEEGIPEERVRVVRNAVDLERFRPRAPLPPRPQKAVFFSNYAREGTPVLAAVRAACAGAGLQLDVVGDGVGTGLARPEEVLGRYDLVFAKARCALEATAVGAAVILCDAAGCGPLVTAAELDRLRRFNFGIRNLVHAPDPGRLAAEIARYDPDDAAEVQRRIRATAGLDQAATELLAIYEEVIAERAGQAAAGPDDLAAEQRAAAAYLHRVTPAWNAEERIEARVEKRAQERIEQIEQRAEERTAAIEQQAGERTARSEERARRAEVECLALRADLAQLQGTAAFRLRSQLLRRPALAAAYRLLRGRS
jgi:Glycosyltransferase Family 4